MEYLENSKYLPDFIKDFDDQKVLFKRLDRLVQARNDVYTKDVNWIAGQVYTIDVFLWFMAKHGYTLQKNRRKIEFENIYDDLDAFENELNEQHANFLKQIINERMNKKNEPEDVLTTP